jgi:hypothetical protein
VTVGSKKKFHLPTTPNIFYVYVYLDPRKPGVFNYNGLTFQYEPFYIGKGKLNRIEEGLSSKRESKYKLSKISSIKESNLDIIYQKLYENLDEKTAFEIEIELIELIGRKKDNGPLCNIHIGGKGGDNFSTHKDKESIIQKWRETKSLNNKPVSKETIDKIKLSHIKRKEMGLYYPHSDETKKKMSNSQKGKPKPKPKTEEYRDKMRNLSLGKSRTQDSKDKQSETCRETLSKMKDKLSLRSSGLNNSNAKKFIIKILETNEMVEIDGYENVIIYYNQKYDTPFKDASYFIKKLKENKVKYIKLIDVININHKIKNEKMKKERLDIKNLETYNILVTKLREFFTMKNFIEVATQPNLTILSACENPFSVATYKYQDLIWPLPQTGQMILEEVLLSNPHLDGCFCISTSYREEKNPIEGRHELLFNMFEFESKGGMEELKKLERDLLVYLGFGEPTEVKYDDICKEYGGVEILEDEHESRMWKELGSVISLQEFPRRSNPFWNMQYKGDGLFNKIDVILYGQETIGSAVRSSNVEEMRDMFYKTMDGMYSEKLFELFGKERVEKELEEFLSSFNFFERYGGGIGLTRLSRAYEMLQEEKSNKRERGEYIKSITTLA